VRPNRKDLERRPQAPVSSKRAKKVEKKGGGEKRQKMLRHRRKIKPLQKQIIRRHHRKGGRNYSECGRARKNEVETLPNASRKKELSGFITKNLFNTGNYVGEKTQH